MKKWFLSPFKGERYHFLDFQEGQVPQNLEEKFNYRYSSLYSVIEQTFGVWENFERYAWLLFTHSRIHYYYYNGSSQFC